MVLFGVSCTNGFIYNLTKERGVCMDHELNHEQIKDELGAVKMVNKPRIQDEYVAYLQRIIKCY